ncbi:MAG: exodeoxyribonuclease III [Magnetococcales bacterium]|nr:exodeoxyribonuclease III [Magnetococcales bacterium]NGZ25490.1 exodeoxyribonuclease III [Magnetococcales bacterium]
MKIATWNVNSLTVRLQQVVAWLNSNPVDVLCLQELKQTDEMFPKEVFQKLGYHAWWRGQKTYNGVAIISRLPGDEVVGELPHLEDPQRRFLAVTVQGVRVVCLYIPNGGELDSDKYAYKKQWLAALFQWLEGEYGRYPRLVVTGDYNIAPAALDVHKPAMWEATPIFSPEMQESFRQMLAMGFGDCFRTLHPQEVQYTWWDYRLGGFSRNQGLRIDHILASPAMLSGLASCVIDKIPRGWDRPSDHAPVVATFE